MFLFPAEHETVEVVLDLRCEIDIEAAILTIDTVHIKQKSVDLGRVRPRIFHRAVGWLVFRIDDRLRANQLVYEFSQRAINIFRMQVRRFDQDVVVGDATRAFVGDRIIDLHIWNEHLPIMRGIGSLRWARRMHECLHASLCDLADHLQIASGLDDVDVIRANMGFGTAAQTRQLVRISSWYGFEPIEDVRPLRLRQRLHRLGENILISLMVFARNGEALRFDSLSRSRVQVFMSKRALMERYARSQPRLRHAGKAA